jgi:hypothetical protein
MSSISKKLKQQSPDICSPTKPDSIAEDFLNARAEHGGHGVPPAKGQPMTDTPICYDATFDPETTHIMGEAFDGACKELHDIAQSTLSTGFSSAMTASLAIGTSRSRWRD